MSAALGVLASILSIALVWPQVWLSCRHRRTGGISPTSAWLVVSLNLCWVVFGLLTDDPAQFVTNAVVGAANTAVLGALLVTQPQLRTRRALLRAVPAAAALVALALGSAVAVVLLDVPSAAVAGGLGTVISLVGSAAAAVQPLSLLRDRAQDLSGLSVARWYLGAGSCASWAGYGWLGGQPTVYLSAAFGLLCALVVCAVLRGTRGGAPAPSVAVGHRAVLAAA
ncbi:UNVERIFIED_ORG: PQ-loop repeat-containing protein [Bacillus sp. AZ43]